jgi:hypothetical protein
MYSLGARAANRIPKEMVIEYYTGEINGIHDGDAWSTWATLTNNQSNGAPQWLDIQEGATIAAV